MKRLLTFLDEKPDCLQTDEDDSLYIAFPEDAAAIQVLRSAATFEDERELFEETVWTAVKCVKYDSGGHVENKFAYDGVLMGEDCLLGVEVSFLNRM
jgi:hypothetical protein